MPLIYITGLAGSGKSTALRELKRRGCEVCDADEYLSTWEHKMTRERVLRSDHTLITDQAFFDTHDWYMMPERLSELANTSLDRTVFVCGSVANENEIWKYFDKVFCLYVDDQTLERRLMNRKDKDFGKATHELKRVLQLNHTAPQKYKMLGATIIDAGKSTNEITDEIIAALDRHK